MFPYEEIRQPNGDYWESVQQAKDAGWLLNQIWSVSVYDEQPGKTTFLYTTPCLLNPVNVLGYVCTTEHQSMTAPLQYEETITMESNV